MNNITTLGEYIESFGCGVLFAPSLGNTELAIVLSYERMGPLRLKILYLNGDGGEIEKHYFACDTPLAKSEICLLKLYNANKQS